MLNFLQANVFFYILLFILNDKDNWKIWKITWKYLKIKVLLVATLC